MKQSLPGATASTLITFVLTLLLAGVALIPVTVRAEGVAPEPIGIWDFNEGSGTEAADSSGNEVTLSSTGVDSSNWVADIAECSTETRSAIELNGIDEYFAAETSGTDLEPDSVSLLGWVKYDGISEEEGVFAGNLVRGEGSFGYGLEVDDDSGEIRFITSQGTVAASMSFGDYDNEWLLVFGSYDAATGVQSMGIMSDSGPIDFQMATFTAGAINYAYAGDFAIGAQQDSSGTPRFGDMPTAAYDNFQVYDKVIDNDELGAITDSLKCPDPVVEDNDGISKEIEDAAPNGGDANDDGTPDSEQPTVSSAVSPVSGEYVVLEAGGVCSSNDEVLVEEESSVETKDDDSFDYPAGLLDFSLTGCTNGGTETITQHYFGDFDIDNVVLRKYDKTTDTYTDIEDAVLSAVTVGGESAVRAVYDVTDGGELDADGVANGVIVDPVGLGEAVLGAPDTGFEQQGSLTAIASVLTGTLLIGYAITRVKVSKSNL